MLALLNLILLLCHSGAGRPPGTNLAPVLQARADDTDALIEVRRFVVPAQVRPGELRRLTCQYELHGASLHAMKLFKDEREFYRYTPSSAPGDQRLAFPVTGVQVDLSRSGEREIWLRINRRSGGQYRCQVTIEGKFISVSAERRMEVLGAGEASAPGSSQAAAGGGGGGVWRHPPAAGVGPAAQRLPGHLPGHEQPANRRAAAAAVAAKDSQAGFNYVMQSASSAAAGGPHSLARAWLGLLSGVLALATLARAPK